MSDEPRVQLVGTLTITHTGTITLYTIHSHGVFNSTNAGHTTNHTTDKQAEEVDRQSSRVIKKTTIYKTITITNLDLHLAQ